MPEFPPDLADRLEGVAGRKVGDALRRTFNEAQPLMADQGAAFTVQGQSAPINVSEDDAVFDLGGRHRNEACLAVPIVDLATTDVTEVVSDAVGYSVNDQNSKAILLNHRFLDAGASQYAGWLIMTNYTGALYCSSERNDRCDLVFVDDLGAHPLRQRTGSPAYMRRVVSKATQDRSNLADADLDAVHAGVGDELQRVPIKNRSATTVPFTVSDELAVGATHERLALQGGPRPTIVNGTYSGQGTATELGHGKRTYPASQSYPLTGANTLTTSSVTGVSITYGGGPDAPTGYVWGDPTSVGTCSRSNHDECQNCCQNIGLFYDGAAVSVFLGFAAGGTVTLPVIGTVAGAVAGFFGALAIGIVGLIHVGVVCLGECNRLYSTDTGEPVRNMRFRLTAAEYNEEGDQIAYEVTQLPGEVTARWTRDAVEQLVWGGGRVSAVVDGQEAPIRLVRRRGNTYLRSTLDASVINNLAALLSIEPS